MTKAETETYVAEMKVWIQQEELRKQSCIKAAKFYGEQIQSLQSIILLEKELVLLAAREGNVQASLENLKKQSCKQAAEFHGEQIGGMEAIVELEDEQRGIVQAGIDRAWHDIGVALDAQKREEAESEKDSAEEGGGTGRADCDGGAGAASTA